MLAPVGAARVLCSVGVYSKGRGTAVATGYLPFKPRGADVKAFFVDRRDPRMRRSRATRSVGYRLARTWHRLRGGASPEAIADRLDGLRT